MGDKLNIFFSEPTNVFNEKADKNLKKKIVITNLDNINELLEKGQTPKELQFFYGGDMNNYVKLFISLVYIKTTKKFVDYLQPDDCKGLLQWKKISVRIETENIFFNIVNSGGLFVQLLDCATKVKIKNVRLWIYFFLQTINISFNDAKKHNQQTSTIC